MLHDPLVTTLRTPFTVIDEFLAIEGANALRSAIDSHFANPHAATPESHGIWNYWYVPGLYTYLRTSPEKVLGNDLAWAFYNALSGWAQHMLGLTHVTWPNLSLYVGGCAQGLHNDSGNGRFGYVYSLTRDDSGFSGGETIIVREGDLFRSNLTRPSAGSGLYELIAPRFNRLVLFDDRMVHGVSRIEGTMDPSRGRLVLHGHISEGGAFAEGGLEPEAVRAAAAEATERALAASGADPAAFHGPLVLSLDIAEDGSVAQLRVLVDRVVSAEGADPALLVDRIVAEVRALRFPAAGSKTQASVPILFGAPLKALEGQALAGGGGARVEARPQPQAEPALAVQPQASPGDEAMYDAMARADGARAVRERLSLRPGAMRLPAKDFEVYFVPDFLDAEECSGLVAMIDSGRQPSQLLSYNGDPDFRTSESCNVSPADPLVRRVEDKLTALLGIDPPLGETIQGQRYAVGQQFKPHHDFFHTDQPYWEEMKKTGGQRTWTAMIFLNEPDAGGATNFPSAGVTVTPRKGAALVWNNMNELGQPNHNSLHQGMPVEDGLKYVVTKWYRERPWG